MDMVPTPNKVMLATAAFSLECSLTALVTEVGKYYVSVNLNVSQMCVLSD